jgi:hypothetical protein
MGIRTSGRSLVVLTAGALAICAALAPAAGASAAAASAGPASVGSASLGAESPAKASAGAAIVCPRARTTAAPAVLDDVAAVSSRNAWAVGWTSGMPNPVLAHWNGSSWTTVSSPALQAPGLLTAVATFPGGVWAVGASGQTSGGAHRTHLILRVTGSTVQKVPTPGPAGGRLLGVAATSATNAWAVGYITAGGPLILHWNGTAWKRSALPRHSGGRIDAVAATSATNAWAIDTRNRAGSQILHWNGKRWSHVTIPVIAGQTYFLGGVTATSAKNAWAAGSSFVHRTVTLRTVILHWNGTRWRRTPSPTPPAPDGSGLADVGASSAGNAWAVGSTTAGLTVAEHWDGTSWKVVPTPVCGELDGISILPSGRAWAVGFADHFKPLILRWNGTAWKPVPLT